MARPCPASSTRTRCRQATARNPSSPCAPRCRTGAGPAYPSTCAPASAWRRATRRSSSTWPTPHTIFPGVSRPNKLVIKLQPEDGLELHLLAAKGAGQQEALVPVSLDLDFDKAFAENRVGAYERLLLDVIAGRLNLFVRSDEQEEAWAWVEPILRASGRATTPAPALCRRHLGPPAASALVARDGYIWAEEEKPPSRKSAGSGSASCSQSCARVRVASGSRQYIRSAKPRRVGRDLPCDFGVCAADLAAARPALRRRIGGAAVQHQDAGLGASVDEDADRGQAGIAGKRMAERIAELAVASGVDDGDRRRRTAPCRRRRERWCSHTPRRSAHCRCRPAARGRRRRWRGSDSAASWPRPRRSPRRRWRRCARRRSDGCSARHSRRAGCPASEPLSPLRTLSWPIRARKSDSADSGRPLPPTASSARSRA